MFTHRLKIEGWIPIRDHRIDAAEFGGDSPNSISTANSSRAKLFLIHDNHAGLIGQTADYCIRPVDDEPFADLAKPGEAASVNLRTIDSVPLLQCGSLLSKGSYFADTVRPALLLARDLALRLA